jgi:hypothetical protein
MPAETQFRYFVSPYPTKLGAPPLHCMERGLGVRSLPRCDVSRLDGVGDTGLGVALSLIVFVVVRLVAILRAQPSR